MKQIIAKTKGDKSGSIDDLIKFLAEQKESGATHYSMEWSGDPHWAFKWFEVYRIKTDEEIKKEKIAKLKKELAQLGG